MQTVISHVTEKKKTSGYHVFDHRTVEGQETTASQLVRHGRLALDSGHPLVQQPRHRVSVERVHTADRQ